MTARPRLLRSCKKSRYEADMVVPAAIREIQVTTSVREETRSQMRPGEEDIRSQSNIREAAGLIRGMPRLDLEHLVVRLCSEIKRLQKVPVHGKQGCC